MWIYTGVLHVGNIHFYFQILNCFFFWICQSRTLIGLCVFLVLLILMRLFGIWPFLRGPTEADREAAAEQELLEGMSTVKNNWIKAILKLWFHDGRTLFFATFINSFLFSCFFFVAWHKAMAEVHQEEEPQYRLIPTDMIPGSNFKNKKIKFKNIFVLFKIIKQKLKML